MNILFTADWHIKLGKRNIPDAWQRKRFLMMVDKLNQLYTDNNCDLHIIGGDILDVAKPSTEDLDLYFECIAALKGNIIIYTGNHEMVSKEKSCLANLAAETSRCNPNATIILEPYRSEAFDIIDYAELHNKEWIASKSKICFTHCRGAIPPHVTPEINLERFKEHGYNKVFAGDLHSVSCCQTTPSIPLLYPGSPFNTSFSREIPEDHGAFIINTENQLHEWHQLEGLPQLIRKTVDSTDKMVSDPFHRVIYELVGDVVSLGKVKNSELLDKKINTGVTKDATLKGLDGDISNEVSAYCKEILGLKPEQVGELLNELHNVVILDNFND